MTVAQLVAVRDAARAAAGKPGAHDFDDFIIFNGPCADGRRPAACSRRLARV